MKIFLGNLGRTRVAVRAVETSLHIYMAKIQPRLLRLSLLIKSVE